MLNEVQNEKSTLRKPDYMDYIAIARFDHITKQVFIIPGIVLAYLLRGSQHTDIVWHVLLGLASAILVASANYTINEWLDRDFDRHHPTKSARTSVLVELAPQGVLAQWLLLVGFGLGFAAISSFTMFCIASVFALQGIVYNVRPFRSKEIPYLDVISEAINNPLRMMIGWAMIDPSSLPPASILLAYWTGGAFLMAAKRLSEYREITASHGIALLSRYRASFARYTETTLTCSCLLYALLSAFFLAVFLIKYRIEYLLTLPVFAALFVQYLALSMQAGSVAQKPEKLFSEKRLVVIVGVLIVTLISATLVDIPWLDNFSSQKFIVIT